MSTSLYRHFADDGSLLYVGISLSWPARTKAHERGSQWFDQVAKVEIERFDTREAALDAERQAIKAERPQFNIVHNRQNSKPPRRERWQKSPVNLTAESMRFLGARERRRAIEQFRRETARARRGDPFLELIAGPDAIVGPALVYRDDMISVIIAHGVSGVDGVLDEIVIGRYSPDIYEPWMDACATVLTIRAADEYTIEQAGEIRADLIKKLRGHLRSVEEYDSDLSLAVAYASHFPSKKSRQILEQVAEERGAMS